MTDLKKIYIFTIAEYPKNTIMSGGAKFTLEISKYITRAKVPVTFFTSIGGKDLYLKDGGDSFTYIVIDNNYFNLNSNLFIYSLQYLRLIIKGIYYSVVYRFRQSEDIVFSASDFFPDILPCLYLKIFKNIKWVGISHLISPNPFKGYERANTKSNGVVFPRPKTAIFYIMQKISFVLMKYYADKIIVVNPLMKEYITHKFRIDNSLIDVVYHGIDKFLIESVSSKNKIYDGIFLGRFHQQKGIFDLIKIWKEVCDVKRNAKLGIIGSGLSEMTAKLIEQIRLNKLENNISLLGVKIGEEKYKILKQSKIFLFPSTYESFGIVALEAMACGLPVVAYDLPEFKYIFPRGIVKVPVGEIQRFASAVVDLLDNGEKYSDLSKNAYEFSKDKDWSSVGAEILNIFQKV